MGKKKHKATVGEGHGGHTPNLPVIRELGAMTGMQPGTKAYRMGKVRILLSPPFEGMGWHMSISRPDRYPSWDEIAKARYELMPKDITVVMFLPPPEEYINIHNCCFHLHEFEEKSHD